VLALALVLTMVPAVAMADATVDVATADELADALGAGFGTQTDAKVTINITANIDVTGKTWSTPRNTNVKTLIIKGNNHTITGMTNTLVNGVGNGYWYDSSVEFYDLTIDQANINSTSDYVGAFLRGADVISSIKFDNCKLTNSTVKGNDFVGGLVGWTSWPAVEVIDCEVSGSTLVGGGSTGGIIGHACADVHGSVTIKNSVVKDNTITSTDDNPAKAGDLVGTVNIGKVSVDATAENNTVTSNNVAVDRIFGRLVLVDTGKMEITGGQYDTPRENNTSYNGVTVSTTTDTKFEGEYTNAVPEPTPIPEEAPIPETGDGMGLFVFAGLALISMLGMVVLKKREQF